MADSVMRRLILARAMAVEPIARALCPEVAEVPEPRFSRPEGRWRSAATQAAWSACDATNLPYGLTREQIGGHPQSGDGPRERD